MKNKYLKWKYSITLETPEDTDMFYFNYKRDAEDFLNQLLRTIWDNGTVIKLYDRRKKEDVEIHRIGRREVLK